MPPAVRSAAKEMPRPDRKNLPANATTNRILVAINVPRMAMDRLSAGVAAAVNAVKTAATSIGDTVANSAANATLAVSII